MKDKFELFNDMKIDEDKYNTVTLTEEEKNRMKSRMKNSVNKRNVVHKKLVAVASAGVIAIGGIMLSSETTWAYIENIGRQIEIFLNKDEEEFKGYKVSVNKEVNNDGIKITLKELMLDDGQMILSLNLDTKEFDYSKLGEDLNEKNTTIDLNTPQILINDMVYSGTTSKFEVIENPDGTDDILIKTALDMVDTDNDGVADKEYPILDNIDPKLDYDLRIIFKDFTSRKADDKGNMSQISITSQSIKLDGGEGIVVDSSKNENPAIWEFRKKINGSKIMENVDIYTLNKEIKIDYKDMNGTLTIESVRVSPVSAKIKYRYISNVNMHENGNQTPPSLDVYDEKGNMIGGSGAGNGDEYSHVFVKEVDLSGKEKAIVMKVWIDDEDEIKYIDNGEIKVDLNK